MEKSKKEINKELNKEIQKKNFPALILLVVSTVFFYNNGVFEIPIIMVFVSLFGLLALIVYAKKNNLETDSKEMMKYSLYLSYSCAFIMTLLMIMYLV